MDDLLESEGAVCGSHDAGPAAAEAVGRATALQRVVALVVRECDAKRAGLLGCAVRVHHACRD